MLELAYGKYFLTLTCIKTHDGHDEMWRECDTEKRLDGLD